MNYLEWQVGMKVVCVDPTWGAESNSVHQMHFCPNLPEAGKVYTIRTIECRMVVRGQSDVVLIRLEEVHNPIKYREEPVFFAMKFRPLETRKTDISIFTAMLTSAKERERA